MNKKNVSVIIPVYNAGPEIGLLVKALKESRLVKEVILIDSGSFDGTEKIARECGAKVYPIKKSDFDHGSARNIGAKNARGKILVFMTQDAFPAGSSAILKLISPLMRDKTIAVSFGRQLPAASATPFAAHLRFFNYPKASRIKSAADKKTMGIKAAFVSNSFAAYRKDALKEIGWFKSGLSMGEDVYAGAKLLVAGYSISYTAGAEAIHSHNYGILQEFARYVNIGYFYKKEGWLIEAFGNVENEAVKFALSEIKYLASINKYHLVPVAIIRNAAKYAGLTAGRIKAMLFKLSQSSKVKI
jgi:rhamnosyltransferase